MMSIGQILECRRTARNLQRFLDRDPSMPLSEDDRVRVQLHLAECEKCAAISEEYQMLHRSLKHLSTTMEPPPESIERVRVAVHKVLDAEPT
jgi:anti-sigma factor RsiW